MKNALKTLVIATVLVAPALAFAQSSGNFVYIDQAYKDTLFPVYHTGGGGTVNFEFTAYIGNGWSGSTTGAFVQGSATRTSPGEQIFRVDIEGFPDSTYTTNTTVCTYDDEGSPAGTYTDTIAQLTNVFQQLNGGCTLDPALYYTITVSASAPAGDLTNFRGTVNSPIHPDWTWIDETVPAATTTQPYFAIVGNNFTISTPNYGEISTTTCSITNLSGCFQNALTWAFFPPNGSLSGILSLQGLLNNKPPFGYFTEAENDISNLGAATSSMYTLGAVSGITNIIFDPIDLGLTAIWWAIFGIWFFFNRVRHIDI